MHIVESCFFLSLLFGDAMMVVDLGWKTLVHIGRNPLTGPIVAHAGVFQTLTRTPSMHPRIVRARLPLQMTLACSSLQIRPS